MKFIATSFAGSVIDDMLALPNMYAIHKNGICIINNPRFTAISMK